MLIDGINIFSLEFYCKIEAGVFIEQYMIADGWVSKETLSML